MLNLTQDRDIEQLKYLFKITDIGFRPQVIRKMEQLSEWMIAAGHWDTLGEAYKSEANACRFIYWSNRRGDMIREKNQPLMNWVADVVERGELTYNAALAAIYPQQLVNEKEVDQYFLQNTLINTW
jgi:hypothetical protein